MTTKILHASDMDDFECLELDHFQIGFYTQRSPEKPGPNEDSLGIAVKNKQIVLAVADGVGGYPKGEEASHLVIEQTVKAFSQLSKVSEIPLLRNYLLDAIETSNQSLLDKNNGARTTLTLCSIVDATLRSYQVGDSSLMLCGQKGLLKYKTVEQSPVGYAVQSGMLSEKEALNHPQRHLLFNVVGDQSMFIELGPYLQLAGNDTILLATDGLLDNIYYEDLIEIIRKESLEEVMRKLCDKMQLLRDVEHRKSLLKSDDVSFIVCRLR